MQPTQIQTVVRAALVGAAVLGAVSAQAGPFDTRFRPNFSPGGSGGGSKFASESKVLRSSDYKANRSFEPSLKQKFTTDPGLKLKTPLDPGVFKTKFPAGKIDPKLPLDPGVFKPKFPIDPGKIDPGIKLPKFPIDPGKIGKMPKFPKFPKFPICPGPVVEKPCKIWPWPTCCHPHHCHDYDEFCFWLNFAGPEVVFAQTEVVEVPVMVERPMAPLPDLIVSRFKVMGTRQEGDAWVTTLKVTIRNAGAGDAPATMAAVALGENDPAGAPVAPLRSGQSITITVETKGMVAPGMTVNIMADAEGTLPESNKDNNLLQEPFTG